MDADIKRWLIGKKEIEKLLSLHRQVITDQLREGAPSYSPQVCVMSRREPDGEFYFQVFIVEMDFNDPEEKYQLMRSFGRHVHALGMVPVAVSMSAEAWSSIQKPGPLNLFMPARHDPDRKEIIMISALGLGEKLSAMVVGNVHRNKKNHWRLDGFEDTLWDVEANILKEFYYGFFEKTMDKLAQMN